MNMPRKRVVIAGVLAAALAGATIIAKWWTAHFLGDAAVAACLATVAVFGRAKCLALARSVESWLRSGNAAQRFAVAVSLLLAAVATGFFAASLVPYYRARLFWAKFDLHWARAASYLDRGMYRDALTEFDRQGGEYRFVSARVAERARAAEDDTRRRMARVKELLERFHGSTAADRTPSLDDLLLAGQAAVLDPRDQRVAAARKSAQRILSSAIDLYERAVEAFRDGREEEARRLLSQSRKTCSGVLHQDLLMTPAAPPELLAWYRREPPARIRSAIEHVPDIAWLAGRTPASGNVQ